MSQSLDELIGSLDSDGIDLPAPGQKNEAKGKKPVAKYWINVGVERGGKLLSLPMGIPLDNLKAKPVPGPSSKNADFRAMRANEAKLWEKIEAIKAQLKPGEERELPFTVRIRMCEAKELTELESASDPYALGDLGI